MKVVRMAAPGGPEVLKVEEAATPRPAETEVLVRLEAAGVNPVDTKIRARGPFTGELPAVLGCDGAGTVEAVGGTVSGVAAGDAVWFCHGGLGGPAGCYAEYAVVPAAVVRPKPKAFGFLHAAAAPLVLITAWEALFDRGRLESGRSVLIHGGAGGVGHVAVQLAKHAGARVLATVGSREQADFVCGLGADDVIFHRDQDFVAEVDRLTAGRGVDLALDSVGGEVFDRTVAAVAHYGDLVTILAPGDGAWTEARNRNLRIGMVLMLTPMLRDLPEARRHQGEILDRCARLADEGRLHVHIRRTFDLVEAAAAHEYLEGGHMQGKVVLEVGGDTRAGAK